MTGHLCPECGEPWGTDGRAGPGCDCTERAARTPGAEWQPDLASAVHFDPLRIRPYVTLRSVDEGGGGGEPDPGTIPLTLPHVVDPAPRDEPHALDPVDLTPARHRRPRRQYTGLMVVVAAVAVAGTAAVAGGLFSGGDEREKALPDRKTGSPSLNVLPDGPSSSPSRSAPVSATVSGSASASPSVTAFAAQSAPRASADSSGPAAAPPSTASATGSAPQAAGWRTSGTLRSGDSGPQVTELQQRLAEMSLYAGPMDGTYSQSVEDAVRAFQQDRHVKGDPEGVYGPKTRRALEAETREP
ncbi:peptidoglycan-binding protein [Streptomyces sp. NBC_01210]|uniref:peptidoglycan-binding domain-containing protein n=1 Tax=Streptomyces sp. NBC_01210 TaxID=2903774 RepID=UPI002E105C1C|nr:peptidoglycan-binding protein [Streptomyces sp. NBC_01210]